MDLLNIPLCRFGNQVVVDVVDDVGIIKSRSGCSLAPSKIRDVLPLGFYFTEALTPDLEMAIKSWQSFYIQGT